MKTKKVDGPDKTFEVRADVNTLLAELTQLLKPASPSSDPPAEDRRTKHETGIIVRGK